MVSATRLARLLRLDVAAGLMAWAGVEVMAHPAGLVAALDDPRLTHPGAFKLGSVLAFVACCFLALRWVARLVRVGRRMSWNPSLRGTQGTVMAEFALVLPIVLLLIGTVIQIALISQAAVVVRYAAFAAARSAIVSFDAETRQNLTANFSNVLSIVQVPPFPEWVNDERPEQAAHLVLAALSPRADAEDPHGRAMESLLKAQGGYWSGGDFARRMAYARSATQLFTIRDKYDPGALGATQAWHDSWAPLIPFPEHVVQPARQKANQENVAYLLPKPPDAKSLIPDTIPIPITIPIPSPFDLVVPPITITVNVPLPRALIDPVSDRVDDALEVLRQGSAQGIRNFALSPANVDPFAPKEVEITLVYDFKLAIPSLLQLAPGVTRSAPGGIGRAFRLEHADFFTVRLQSTGGRRSLMSLMPVVPDLYGSVSSQSYETVPNTPLYWRSREVEEDEDEDDDDDDDKDDDDDDEKKKKDDEDEDDEDEEEDG